MWGFITSSQVAPLELDPLFTGGSYKQVAPTELKSLLLYFCYKWIEAKRLARARKSRYPAVYIIRQDD